MADSPTPFFMLDGFDELVWDGIYWSGQLELPAWKDFNLKWLEQQEDEGEDGDDPFEDMSPEDLEELREASKYDPAAKELLELFEARDEELPPEIVELKFSVADTDDLDDDEYVPPTPYLEQIAAATYARDHTEHVQEIILKDALEIYHQFKPEAEEMLDVELPTLTQPSQLKDHLKLVAINPLSIAKDGVAYLAYYFTCTWDLEEGMPYILHKDRIVLVGLTEPEADEQALLDDGGEHLGVDGE